LEAVFKKSSAQTASRQSISLKPCFKGPILREPCSKELTSEALVSLVATFGKLRSLRLTSLEHNPAPPNTQLVSPGRLKGIEGATVAVDGTVTPKVPENASMSWGIRCKAVGNGTSYYLGISYQGVPEIWKDKGGGSPILKPSWSATDEQTSAAFKEGTATNRLRADCSGSRMTLDVNNQKVLEAPADTEIKAAKIGLWVEDVDVDANILFDNFVINGPKPLR
jgi:hypothetical protein